MNLPVGDCPGCEMPLSNLNLHPKTDPWVEHEGAVWHRDCVAEQAAMRAGWL